MQIASGPFLSLGIVKDDDPEKYESISALTPCYMIQGASMSMASRLYRS